MNRLGRINNPVIEGIEQEAAENGYSIAEYLLHQEEYTGKYVLAGIPTKTGNARVANRLIHR